MHREVIVACLPYLLAICVSLGCLCLLLRVSGARLRIRNLACLHRDQTGAVQSLSFVLTLPIFVMFLMLIVQLTQLTIGRIVVEYAAFAAARSAIVWIPANLGCGTEQENRISSYTYLGEIAEADGNTYSEYLIEPNGPKFNKIHFAAAMACMPICPSHDVGSALDHPGNEAASAMIKAYHAYAPEAVLNARVPGRIRHKLAYALNNTQIDIVVRHKHEEPELAQHHRKPHPEEFTFNEIGWQDQILVTVRHNFALLPGPGRLLSRSGGSSSASSSASGDNSPSNAPAQGVSPSYEWSGHVAYGTSGAHSPVFTYVLKSSVRLGNEGEKPVLPYIQQTYGGGSVPDYPIISPGDQDAY